MPKFVPRERKHRRLAAQKQDSRNAFVESQPNEDVIVPESKTERDVRRAQLSANLRAQQPSESKISSKKRKRLDKYVDNKLRKEESLDLLKKLAAHKVDTSLLRSSKKLGRVTETKRDRITRALQEKNAGINTTDDHDEILYQRRPDIDESLVPSGSDDGDDDNDDASQPGSIAGPDEVTDPMLDDQAGTGSTLAMNLSFGKGLKRPLDVDESGRPVIAKRKRRKQNHNLSQGSAGSAKYIAAQSVVHDEHDDVGSGEDDEWEGFGSDTSGGRADTGSESDIQSSSTEDASVSEHDDDDDDDDLLDQEDSEDEDELDSSVQGDSSLNRVSAFKAWANLQRNVALDFTPSSAHVDDAGLRAKFKPRPLSPDPLLDELSTIEAQSSARPATAITILRDEEVQAARLELPVVQEEQKIMEAIHSHPIIVICGATGSGKTTQVPQMMYESGYGSYIGSSNAHPEAMPSSRGLIGVTQPRRVAAVSVAERVATEMGTGYRAKVAHQVRYDSNVGRDTAIKFMTDGILLREISQDFILSRYSAIIIDEAHERSVNTDILIGMLSRIVKLRSELAKEQPDRHYPLKLVIMSATLRVADFAQNRRLFPTQEPPIVQAEGRQFPVTEHFSRKTHRDYVTEMVNKVARGHRKLPPGAMLVFLTAQNEILTVAQKLREKLGGDTGGDLHVPTRSANNSRRESLEDDHEDLDVDAALSGLSDPLQGEDSAEESDPEITGLDPEGEDDEFAVEPDAREGPRPPLKPYVLPLYAALPPAQQLRVFQPVPEGRRLIVLATNVAETSLTIPGVRFVFDCGRAKEKRYDEATGVQTFEIDWISKASASQRMGRAGRTGAGHCYRLYSSAVYEQFFAEHTVPEILRTPLESTVLQLRNIEIDNIINFPFPTTPNVLQLGRAEHLLRNLGAINEKDGRITASGKEIMTFPVNPRFGKMLLLARRNGVLAHTIALVAGLAVGDLLIPEVQVNLNEEIATESNDNTGNHGLPLESAAQSSAQKQHQAYTRAQAILARLDERSDAIKLLTAVAAHVEASSRDRPMTAASRFCQDFFLREKGMQEVQQLRRQLHNIVTLRYPQFPRIPDKLPVPSDTERKMINQIVTAGFIDQVAIRTDLLPDSDTTPTLSSAQKGIRRPRRAIDVAYRTLQTSSDASIAHPVSSAEEQSAQQNVFVHASSVLARLSVDEMPAYIIYSHLSRPASSSSKIEAGASVRTRMHPLTVVGSKQLATLAEGTPLLEFGKPIGKIEDVMLSTTASTSTSHRQRICWIGVSLKSTGDLGARQSWPLGAWKVLQQRKGNKWEIEKVISR